MEVKKNIEWVERTGSDEKESKKRKKNSRVGTQRPNSSLMVDEYIWGALGAASCPTVTPNYVN